MKTALLSLIVAISILMGSVVALPSTVSAGGPSNCRSSFLTLPVWYKYLDWNAECDITGPVTSEGSIDWTKAGGYVGLAIVEILLRIAALVSVGFVILGGFRYITSQGEPENAKSARQTIQNAIIGLVISILATGIVAFIAAELS